MSRWIFLTDKNLEQRTYIRCHVSLHLLRPTFRLLHLENMSAGLDRTDPNVIIIHGILFEHSILCQLLEPFALITRVAEVFVVFRTVGCVTTQRRWAPFINGKIKAGPAP